MHVKMMIAQFHWRRTAPGNPDPLSVQEVYDMMKYNKEFGLKEFKTQIILNSEMISLSCGLVGFKKQEEK